MIKNTYLKCAVVLSCICVSSAVLIGGLNAVAESYKESHKSTEAPAIIQKLKSGAQFVEVTGDMPKPTTENSTKVSITAIYALQENGKTTGFAYMVNCGTPVKTPVSFSILFEGPASEDAIASVKPTAINIEQGGDSGYDTNVVTLAKGMVDGSVAFEDYSAVLSGGTKSQKFFIDGVTAARRDYVSRINGQAPEVKEETPADKLYDNVKKDEKDENFSPISFSYNTINKGQVLERHHVTLDDDSVVMIYKGHAEAIVNEYDPSAAPVTIDIWISFSGAVEEGKSTQVKPAKYWVENSTFSFNQWESDYLPAIFGGTSTIDDANAIKTGATISSGVLRNMMKAMRDDYYKTKLAEQKSDVEGSFKVIYKNLYSSFAADTFETVSATTSDSTYKITARYTVSLSDSTTTKAYVGTTTFKIEDEFHDISIIAGFSGSATAAKLDGYVKLKSEGFGEWDEEYLAHVVDGSKSLDDDNVVGTGATLSVKAVRDLTKAMRANYIASIGE